MAFTYSALSVLGEKRDLNIPPGSASQPWIRFGGHGYDKLGVQMFGAPKGDREAVQRQFTLYLPFYFFIFL